jgi:lipoprotein-releasing system permease protein
MIVAVAAFNLVATLVMIVKDKQPDIALLRTLGASPRGILGAFALQGILIGLAGTLAGAALGVLVARNVQSLVAGLERLIGVRFLDPQVYFMSDLPAARRRPGLRRSLRALRPGHPLSGLARGADPTGGGPAT